jgi:hypothetical protein
VVLDSVKHETLKVGGHDAMGQRRPLKHRWDAPDGLAPLTGWAGDEEGTELYARQALGSVRFRDAIDSLSRSDGPKSPKNRTAERHLKLSPILRIRWESRARLQRSVDVKTAGLEPREFSMP